MRIHKCYCCKGCTFSHSRKRPRAQNRNFLTKTSISLRGGKSSTCRHLKLLQQHNLYYDMGILLWLVGRGHMFFVDCNFLTNAACRSSLSITNFRIYFQEALRYQNATFKLPLPMDSLPFVFASRTRSNRNEFLEFTRRKRQGVPASWCLYLPVYKHIQHLMTCWSSCVLMKILASATERHWTEWFVIFTNVTRISKFRNYPVFYIKLSQQLHVSINRRREDSRVLIWSYEGFLPSLNISYALDT